jgi:hypothetical protein
MSSPTTNRAWFCLVPMLLGCLLTAAGQSTGGRVIGKVSDSTGAVVGGVNVKLINTATGVAREATSNDNGDFTFVEVVPGNYRVEYTQQGFKKNVRDNVTLEVNQVLTLNATLQPGGTQEVVEVTSEAPLVDTTSTQLGAVVNDRAINQLPLNERDTYQFLQLQPGVQSQLGGNSDLFYGSDKAGTVSVNGGRGRANNFSVNGGDANDIFVNLPTVQPSPDSVEEFRVLTNTFDAEYGRNSGAVVNVVTKSGTNRIHGDVYDYLRNRVLNAKGYFDTVKPAFIQNQFGGTLGGPIKKDRTFFFTSYEGRRVRQGKSGDTVAVPTDAERTGDFSGGPGFSGGIVDNFVAQVLDGRAGCDSALGIASVASLPTDASGAIPWASVFPNSIIPSACQDPVAADLLRLVPHLPAGASFYQAVPVGKDRQDQLTLRFDHHINSKQVFTGYYYLTDESLFQPFAFFQQAGANVPGFGSSVGQRFQQYNLTHTWTVTNTVVNEARFTYMREAQRTFQHPQHTDLVTNSCSTPGAQAVCFNGHSDSSAIESQALQRLGIQPGLGPTHEGVPDVQVNGGVTYGNNFEGELPQVGNSFQWSDSLTKVAGNHTFKFGADVRRQRFDQTLYFEVNGYYIYNGVGQNDVVSSDLYPDYLLGLPDQYQQGAAQHENVRSTGTYLFAQDSWKIRPSLTLNYGLRWEFDSPITDIGHRVQTFRPGQTTQIYPCQISPYGASLIGTSDCTSVFPTGLVVPGDKGVPPGLTQSYHKAFAPRIGLAWSPDHGKTSIRAGWGMFYNPIEQLVLEQFSAEPPFGGSIFLFNPFFNTPFYAQGQFQYPNPFNPAGGTTTGILDPQRNQPVDWSVFRPLLLFGEFQPHMRTQYSDQYNLTIQRELSRNLVLQLGYVGSQGHRLLITHELNPTIPRTCLDIMDLAAANPNNVFSFGSPANCGPGLEDDQFTLTIPQGFTFPNSGTQIFHMPNGKNLNTGTFSSGGQSLQFVGLGPYSSPQCNAFSPAPFGDPSSGCPPDGVPVFENIFAQDTIANSNYNSLQASLEKRFSHGLQAQVAYTFSKSIDQGSSFEDILNPFNPRYTRGLSLFDARHRFVASYYWELPVPKYSGVAGKVADGWAVSGITQFQSGFPIRLQNQDDTELTASFDFSAPATPDQIAPFKKLNPRKTPNNLGFDPTSFQDSALGVFGNAPHTICCGFGLNNWDLSFQKNTPINESIRTEFRLDIFNVANHTGFFNPDGNFSDGSDFGRVKRARDPRLMQVALKLYF